MVTTCSPAASAGGPGGPAPGTRPRVDTGNDIWIGEIVCDRVGLTPVPPRGLDRRVRHLAQGGADQGRRGPGRDHRARGGRTASSRRLLPECRRRRGRARRGRHHRHPTPQLQRRRPPQRRASTTRCVPLVAGIPTRTTSPQPATTRSGSTALGPARSAWYEFFPRSEGGFKGVARPPRRRGRHGLRRRLPAADPPDRHHRPQGRQQHARRRVPTTSAARGPSAARRAATPPSTPTSAPRTTSPPRRASPRARHGGGARLRAPVLARPPLGHRASRVVPPPPRRHDQVRREPAQEVPGHLPDQLLAGRRDRPASPCGRRAGTSSSTGSTAASRIFRVDNPHTKPLAFWEWCIARDPGRPPRRAVPGRGVHPPGDDVEAGRGRLQPELHVLHLAAPSKRSCSEYLDRARPRAPRRRHAAQLLAQHARHPRRRPARRPPGRVPAPLPAGRHAVPDLRASTRGYELCENEPAVGQQRGVPLLREVRGQAPRLGPARTRWPRSSPRSTGSAGRHPALRRAARTSASTTPTTTTSSPTPRARAPTATWCWWS